jgi:hypothetical protein
MFRNEILYDFSASRNNACVVHSKGLGKAGQVGQLCDTKNGN